MSLRPTTDELRELLRGWEEYDWHEGLDGDRRGYYSTPIPVDDMTDKQLLEVAQRIATQAERELG